MSTARMSAMQFKRTRKGSYAAHQELERAALDLLKLSGVPARPIHTGPRVAPRAGGGFDLRSNRKQAGIADVLGCLPPYGQLLFVDLKSGNARPTREQLNVHQEFARAGAACLVVRDIADLALFLKTRDVTPAAAHGGAS